MQLLDITTNAIALFGAAYFIAALAVHLHHCWEHPPVKAIAAESPVLLLPPAADVHPWQIAAEKQLAIELIAACQMPAVAVEPSIDLPPVEDAPHIEPDAPIDLSSLTIRELKALARDRQLKKYCNFTKAELVAALS